MSFSYHYREGNIVRTTLLATAVAAALTMAAVEASAAPGSAATKAEIQAMQAQMEALAARLGKLEAANTALQAENSELKSVVERRDAETDYLKAQTKDLREEGAVASNELSKLKGADWASRIKFKGDFRMRDENIEQQRVVVPTAAPRIPEVQDAADRNRARFRARFGFDATVTDTVKATFRLASGDGDPRSTNQTLTNIASAKDIWIDQAYTDWNFMNGGNLVLGKQPYPFFRPGQSLFYDGDFNPEGAAVKLDRGMFFGSAYWWWLQENYNASPDRQQRGCQPLGPAGWHEVRAARRRDEAGGQLLRVRRVQEQQPVLERRQRLRQHDDQPGLGYDDHGGAEVRLRSRGTLGRDGLHGVQPAAAGVGDWAQNMASDVEYDTAYNVGFLLNKASNAKTWEFGAMWQEIDKDRCMRR